ncbi:hypothetical protein [Emcibacter nanhaiensis]|uniref:Lipoprotein n=1 Tax=Emcibacter nanhaiensis TaxID=1505037 RepID=A0A501PS75_9PROT|nr:hypothetical protein [Emcibacter nanhaiensis]TPD62636.1 hypothetical protein FIV46_00720 [Emcibacter nanhaiensis]
MIKSIKLRTVLIAACATVALAGAGCQGDDSIELASPGTTGPNPGTGDTSGDTGGSGGSSAGNCPSGTADLTVGTETHCELSGTLTSNITLTAENLYVIDGLVIVGEDVGYDGTGGAPVTLTIEPGTTIYGKDENSVLSVSRGSQLMAEGSNTNPIIFTSAQDLGFDDELGLASRAAYSGAPLEEPWSGEWGGVVLNGRATTNVNCVAGVCEGIDEVTNELYGGDDDADSSGSLKFVQVKYAGFKVNAISELNGIAMQGIGSGTEVDYVQVHNNSDDGIEFFGGTVNAKHLVVTGSDDDSFDWTFGWRGNIQYAIAIQNPNQENTDRGIEADNNEDDNTLTPRSNPTWSNITFVGIDSSPYGDTGIVLRRGTAASFYNAVVTDFTSDCLDVDGSESYAQLNAGEIVMESTLLDCTSNFANEDEDGADEDNLPTWFADQDNNTLATNSLSVFVNGATEQGVTATDANAVNAFFDTTDYIGAVNGPNDPENWTLGWTYGMNDAAVCPTGTTDNGDGGCVLEGTYTDTMRLVAGLDYFLRGQVNIGVDVGYDGTDPDGDPATLIVDAGVTIYGEDTNAVLNITRGSKIFVNGTEDAPVTMTATNDGARDIDTASGLWGGLILNGRASTNVNCVAGVCEGIDEVTGDLYGGDDDTDNSGRLSYLVVKYAGFKVNAISELNGVAMQGIGNGTEVNYVQVHNNSDDGFEFFGGTVNAKHLVVTGSDDDSFDWTFGWRGKVQYAIAIQNPNQPNTDRGIEADNNEDDNTLTPRSNPTWSNITFVGIDSSPYGDTGIVLRRGTAASFYNAVVASFTDDCLDIDGSESYDQLDAGNIVMQSTLLDCNSNFANEDEDGADEDNLPTWFAAQANTTLGGSTLAVPSDGTKKYINGTGEAAVTATDANAVDAFFDTTSYIGAVENAAGDWTAGWTVWIHD